MTVVDYLAVDVKVEDWSIRNLILDQEKFSDLLYFWRCVLETHVLSSGRANFYDIDVWPNLRDPNAFLAILQKNGFNDCDPIGGNWASVY